MFPIFVEGPVGLRRAWRGAARGRRRLGSLSRGDGARAGVFFVGCPWCGVQAARRAALLRGGRTLGSFLMRRGGMAINAAALALLPFSQVW